jgi:hypothetical protein
MAQAEPITTAIRELMSRDWPPTSTSRVQAPHQQLAAALPSNPPHPTCMAVESDDLDSFAEQLKQVWSVQLGQNTEGIRGRVVVSDRQPLETPFAPVSTRDVGEISTGERDNGRAS